jgi:class 3 adenylate cyclase/tetratricopeptide (TPR) repeat protein
MRQGRSSATATVLFSDLVGSTGLLSQLGEAAFDRVRRAHFEALRHAIERTGGQQVKTLGDGVLATFGSAADAVACAVAMQQAVDGQARRAGVPLTIRVGLALGDLSFEEEDVFGTPVVQAARLVAAARPGQILATAVVLTVAGGRTGATFSDIGLLELKGLPEPVAACEVTWERLPEPAVPLPALLTEVGRVFVGRQAEMERLSQFWKEAAAGVLRVAFLAGEPGVGKTRLAAELATAAHAEGAVVLVGRCDEDLGVPYQPFVEALRHLVDHTPAEDLAGRLGRYVGELVRLVPELADRVPGLPAPLRSDPETERYRLFDATAAWLGAAAAEGPVLVVLDDLQWATKPTLLLLRHVVRSTEPTRLLVLGTYRDSELGHDHPLVELLADLRRLGGVERLSLTGLDSSGVAVFMERVAGHPLTDQDLLLARAIYQETEGNPFFVREVLRHLTETGAVQRQEGRWLTRAPVDTLEIPEGIREVVGRRVARLSAQANRTLRVAAVIGPEFELAVLQRAAGVDEEDLVSALEEATQARLVVEVPGPAAGYRFAHALVRHTLYEGLSAGRRVTLHRRVAQAIEAVYRTALDDHLLALAHHWARASAPAAETSRAVHYATRAGDRALAQLAHDEAAAYYRSALELLDAAGERAGGPERLRLLIALGQAQRRAGDPDYRETLLTAARLAREQGNTAALAEAALANTRAILYSVVGAVDHERVAVLEQALAATADATDSPIRARLLATLGLELTWGSRRRRLELSGEALELARRLGDPATLAEVLQARFYACAAPDTRAERLANTAELLALADQLGDDAVRSRALALRFRVAMESADVAEADRCLEANQRLTADLGQPTLRWFVDLQRAGRSLLAGRLEEAERLAHDALELGQSSGQPEALGFFVWLQAAIRFEQGRLGEVLDPIRQAAADHPRASTAKSVLARAYAELDRTDEARAVYEELAASEFTDLPVDPGWLRTLTHCATVCAYLGDAARAAALYRLLAPYPDQLSVSQIGVLASSSVQHYLGLLATTMGRFDDAEARFAAAATTHQRIQAPTWLARTRLEWARTLLVRRQAGDVERARELLGQAIATARELGLGTVERRAVALLH